MTRVWLDETSDSSWEFRKIENKQVKAALNDPYLIEKREAVGQLKGKLVTWHKLTLAEKETRSCSINR